MVEVLTSLGIKYIAINPGASFRGLHESLINASIAERPGIITCLHEEQAVAFAHGCGLSRYGGVSARFDGRIQRLVRSRTDNHARRQPRGCRTSTISGGVGSFRAGSDRY